MSDTRINQWLNANPASRELSRLAGDIKTTEDVLREFDGETVWQQAQQAVAEIDRLRARVAELTASYLERDADVERLNWLIAEGEKHFGTLWKEATFADIDHVRHGRAAATTGDAQN